MDASYALTLINIFHAHIDCFGSRAECLDRDSIVLFSSPVFYDDSIDIVCGEQNWNIRRHAKSILSGVAIAPIYLVVQTFLFVFA
jgi:hypothetical protein